MADKETSLTATEVEVLQRLPMRDLSTIEASTRLVELISGEPGKMKRPVFTYVIPASRRRKQDPTGFYPGEYPVEDIGMAEDTDSFVYQANFKRLALSLKAGWNLIGRNQETISYIKERLQQIEVAQGQTTRDLLAEVMANLLRYHNCYIIKARDIKRSGGRIRLVGRKKIKPVAGYFVASPDTMTIKIGEDNRPIAYKHTMPDGRYQVFEPDDVVHFFVYKKSHFVMGTPSWTPVLDDVRALRRIEEHIENLVYQHIYPLFQYTVGTKETPMKRFQDGLTEVDIVKTKIRNMPTDGMIVVPERHDIKAIGSESRAIRAEPYLSHFKSRVITGTGLSAIDFGEGETANRSTADTMSKLGVDNVKFYQQALADTFNFRVIRELLLESTFGLDVLSPENNVELKFSEVDLEAQIKKQNHFALLYQMNIITETEARNEMGFEAMSEEQREERYSELVSQKEASHNAEIANTQLEMQVAAQENAAARNTQQPSNQHGTATGPAKKKSFRDATSLGYYDTLAQQLRKLKADDAFSISYVGQLFRVTSGLIKGHMKRVIDTSMTSGLQGLPVNGDTFEQVRLFKQRLYSEMEDSVEGLFQEASRETTAELMRSLPLTSIDSLRYRAKFIERTVAHKAKIAGKFALFKTNNVLRVRVIAKPGGEDYDVWHNLVIDVNSVNLEELPPFHPNCRCDIVPEQINE